MNSLINKLPFEAHIPTYQYCGPGTKLQKRLKRNDPGINELDRACKEHDIAYSKSSDITERNRADNILAKKAWNRFKSWDAGIGERTAALGVSGVMKAKSAMGAGMKFRRKKSTAVKKTIRKRPSTKSTKSTKSGLGIRKKKQKKSVSIPSAFRLAMKNAKSKLKQHKPKSMADATALAVQAAKAAIKPLSIPKNGAVGGLPRVIPVPKIGGIIPLIPVFAGLSALGALMGGSAGVASAVISANKAKKDLNEMKRHNQTVEAISLGKRGGSGLYLKHYKKGYGLYLRQFNPKNRH